VDKLQEHTN